MSEVSINEAASLLANCTRSDDYDYASGDYNVTWRDTATQEVIATGCRSEVGSEVSFDTEEAEALFEGQEAALLLQLGEREEESIDDVLLSDDDVVPTQFAGKSFNWLNNRT